MDSQPPSFPVNSTSLIVTKQKMEVQLPATTKVKFMRQVLVQKERSFIQEPYDLGEWQTPVSKTNLSSCPSPPFLQGWWGSFFSYPIILLTFCALGPCPFKFLAFGKLRVRTSPCLHLGQWGRLLGTPPDCLQ